MYRKLMTACMALAAFAAFAVMPSIASATNDPDLTDSGGSSVPVGTKIKATSIGNLVMTDVNTNHLVTCSSAWMTGELTKNDGSNIEGNVESATFSGTGTNGECTSTFGGITVTTNVTNGIPYCMRSTATMETDEFQVRGGKCSEASREIRYTLDSTTIGECTYGRTAAVVGTYTTTPEDAVVHITHQKFEKKAGGFFCPGEGYLDFTFTLEKDTTPLTTTDPLYIS
jgi:hypothetical protein